MRQILTCEWQRFKGRCIYSSAGLVLAWREEHFFRFWIYMNIGSVLLAFGLPIAPGLRVLILCLGALVLAAECFNMAIERGGQSPLARSTSFGQGCQGCGQCRGGADGRCSRRGVGLCTLGAAVRQLGVVLSDRGSKYAVSGCKVTDRAAIDAALKELKRDKKYAKATHNTWGVLIDGVPLKSDDGESGAGMVILRMLERVGRQNELIIVTRWYGGKHLGGDRFRHVQDATRMYLEG